MVRHLALAVVAFMILRSDTVLLAQTSELASQQPSPPPFETEEPTPLLVQPLATLRPALLSDGTVELNYELELISAVSALVLEGMEVLDPLHQDAVVASWTATQLLPRLRMPGRASPTASWSGGESGYLRVNLTFSGMNAVPVFLDHRFTLTARFPPGPEPSRRAQLLARCSVNLRQPPVLSPPLAGERWVAGLVGGDRAHRNAIMPINGRWVAPERWAVDWIRLDSANRLVTGDPSLNTSFPQYRQPLLAVADGRIVRTRDGMPDIPPGPSPPDITIQDAAGNFVVLDMGQGHFATYGHISPGTLRVMEGQMVRRGQVLGLLGNSGNTTGPHLHFQINDGSLSLASDGLPYVIDQFVVQGMVVSADDLETEMRHPEKPVTVVPAPRPSRHTREMPANLGLISFPERRGR